MLRRQRDFLKLWTGQAISQMGSRITREGLPYTAAIVLGATPFQMGVLSGASAASILIFGLFAGAWADRLRRRPILIVTDIGRALLLGTVPLAAILHRLTMAHLYAVAAIAGVLTVLFDVSYQAYVPSLVERDQILAANSRLALSESVAEVTGPGLTGILAQWLTAPIAIAFDAASFLVSAVSLLLIRKPEPPPHPSADTGMVHEIREGLRTSWENPYLRALAFRSVVAGFSGGLIGSMYVLFSIRVLHLTPAILGATISFGGFAAVAGSAFAERIAKRLGLGRAFIGASLYTGVCVLFFPLAHGSVTTAVVFMLIAQLGDAGWPVYTIGETSLRKSVTPDRLLGRVNSAMHLLFRGIVPVGAFAGGAMASAIGIRQTMLAGAAGFLLSSLCLILSPIRKLEDLAAVAVAD